MDIPLSVGLISLLIGMMIQIGAFSFWMGRLSQRVSTLEKSNEGDLQINNTVIELKVKVEHMEGTIVKMSNVLEGVQRQLANLSMGRVGKGREFPAD